ncbi:hypothetical protein K474DRAFT_1700192 [Panus rudis PR-1116 ss-1]|nr:hypothetical protein K474DRAFT_1700192 [Panus rudis PR-1116 ss-1]
MSFGSEIFEVWCMTPYGIQFLTYATQAVQKTVYTDFNTPQPMDCQPDFPVNDNAADWGTLPQHISSQQCNQPNQHAANFNTSHPTDCQPDPTVNNAAADWGTLPQYIPSQQCNQPNQRVADFNTSHPTDCQPNSTVDNAAADWGILPLPISNQNVDLTNSSQSCTADFTKPHTTLRYPDRPMKKLPRTRAGVTATNPLQIASPRPTYPFNYHRGGDNEDCSNPLIINPNPNDSPTNTCGAVESKTSTTTPSTPSDDSDTSGEDESSEEDNTTDDDDDDESSEEDDTTDNQSSDEDDDEPRPRTKIVIRMIVTPPSPVIPAAPIPDNFELSVPPLEPAPGKRTYHDILLSQIPQKPKLKRSSAAPKNKHSPKRLVARAPEPERPIFVRRGQFTFTIPPQQNPWFLMLPKPIEKPRSRRSKGSSSKRRQHD